ncbi:hypothetical protein ACWESM_18750 [Nocardia sp. NPDC003999]
MSEPFRLTDAEFDQEHAKVRDHLDRLIAAAAARDDLGSRTATVTITGEIAISAPPLMWVTMLAAAVTRLAQIKAAEQ